MEALDFEQLLTDEFRQIAIERPILYNAVAPHLAKCGIKYTDHLDFAHEVLINYSQLLLRHDPTRSSLFSWLKRTLPTEILKREYKEALNESLEELKDFVECQPFEEIKQEPVIPQIGLPDISRLRFLTHSQKQILQMFKNNMTAKQIAEVLELTKDRIDRDIKRIEVSVGKVLQEPFEFFFLYVLDFADGCFLLDNVPLSLDFLNEKEQAIIVGLYGQAKQHMEIIKEQGMYKMLFYKYYYSAVDKINIEWSDYLNKTKQLMELLENYHQGRLGGWDDIDI